MTGRNPKRSNVKIIPIDKLMEANSKGVDFSYCRKCMQVLPSSQFHKSFDTLDSNGLMSVCINCSEGIFTLNFGDTGNLSDAIYRTCRTLNWAFRKDAVEGLEKLLEVDRFASTSILSRYRVALQGVKNTLAQSDLAMPLTFSEIGSAGMVPNKVSDDEVHPDVIMFWGRGYSRDEYEFLETEFSEWSKTHKTGTRSEVALLREVVFKIFEIRKARETQDDTGDLIKQFESLLKTAAIDPQKANLANSGGAKETFGEFIRIIEQNEPADYYKDRELFKDFDGIEQYWKNYVVRPLRNFVTGSRDFNLSTENESDDDAIEIPDLEENENDNIS